MTFSLGYSRPQSTLPQECQKVDQTIKTSLPSFPPSGSCGGGSIATPYSEQRPGGQAAHGSSPCSEPSGGRGAGREEQGGHLEGQAKRASSRSKGRRSSMKNVVTAHIPQNSSGTSELLSPCDSRTWKGEGKGEQNRLCENRLCVVVCAKCYTHLGSFIFTIWKDKEH